MKAQVQAEHRANGKSEEDPEKWPAQFKSSVVGCGIKNEIRTANLEKEKQIPREGLWKVRTLQGLGMTRDPYFYFWR